MQAILHQVCYTVPTPCSPRHYHRRCCFAPSPLHCTLISVCPTLSDPCDQAEERLEAERAAAAERERERTLASDLARVEFEEQTHAQTQQLLAAQEERLCRVLAATKEAAERERAAREAAHQQALRARDADVLRAEEAMRARLSELVAEAREASAREVAQREEADRQAWADREAAWQKRLASVSGARPGLRAVGELECILAAGSGTTHAERLHSPG